MLLAVLDGAGLARTVIAQAQETATDRSGTITATGVSQALMAANANRSGWFVQNNSDTAMTVNELGEDATEDSSITLYPGQTFPPVGYPIPITAISIAGTIDKAFAAREW